MFWVVILAYWLRIGLSWLRLTLGKGWRLPGKAQLHLNGTKPEFMSLGTPVFPCHFMSKWLLNEKGFSTTTVAPNMF